MMKRARVSSIAFRAPRRPPRRAWASTPPTSRWCWAPGWAASPNGWQGARSVPYASLPGFPETTVAGHPGRLIAGTSPARRRCCCGRVHGYEGYPPSEVGFGIRVVAALGVRTLIVTNAAGAVEPSLQPGEIVAISDHINLTSASPLSGSNDERLGPRFVDMTDAYDPALRAIAAASAQAATGRPLREAIYAGMAGPAYETPAEVRLLRTLGAGLVGMSTVHEVITARHAGLSVLGLSLVANPAAGVSPGPLRHEDVSAPPERADALGRLIVSVVAALP